MKKKLLCTLLCLLMTGSLLAGCQSTQKEGSDAGGEDSKKKNLKVGFCIRTQDGPYYAKLAEEVKKQAKEEGWKISILDSNLDISKEAQNMDTFISQGMDLIFLDCIESDPVVPSINSAAEAGIPVINLDSAVGKGAKDVTTVYADNKQNGRLVGLAYAKKAGGDTPVKAILLSGGKGSVAGEERRTGLMCGIIQGRTGCTEDDAWKAAEKMEGEVMSAGKAQNADAKFTIAGQGWGDWTEAGGLKAAEDLITANKDLTCVLGENDQMLFGAIKALENANIKNVDIVAGADGAQAAYDLIKEGKYFATGENSPVKIAMLGMKIAKEILIDGKDPHSYKDITTTEPAAVTKENVDEHYKYGF